MHSIKAIPLKSNTNLSYTCLDLIINQESGLKFRRGGDALLKAGVLKVKERKLYYIIPTAIE